MPLVFVHGVATRQTPQYQAAVAQRDTLFKRLVMGQDQTVFDPDWGSGGVKICQGGLGSGPGRVRGIQLRLPGGDRTRRLHRCDSRFARRG